LALGLSLLIPPVTVTAIDNSPVYNTTGWHRDLQVDPIERDLLTIGCTNCKAKPCITWCGCNLCSSDRRRLSSYNGNEYRGGRSYGTKSPSPQPTPRPTNSPTPQPTLRARATPAPTTLYNSIFNKGQAVNFQIQTWARLWVAVNDNTHCMGQPGMLVVNVTFF
jgi:hypothetical protein